MVDKTRKPSKPSETTKTSKAKIDANRRYNEKTFDVLQCRVKKDEHINQRIDDAVEAINATIDDPKAKISKASFILDAIKAKLDGQPAPTPAPEPAPAAQTPIGEEYLNILLPAGMHYNERIAEAVYNGAAKSGRIFVMQALDRRLREADQMM
jgi:hypothetical protein